MTARNTNSRNSILVLAFCALLLLWNLGYAPFWNPDEGRYAAASLEMARGFNGQTPDWVVPHLNTMPRLNKPPLVYWLGATNFNLFGAHEWAGRLGSALAAIGVMLLVWSFARRVWSERCGLFAAIIWTTSLFSFGMARVMNTDMLLCGAITLACYGLWHAIEYSNGGECSNSDGKTFQFKKSFLLVGVGMGLALLAKGPVGLAFPLLIAFVFLLVSRRWQVLQSAPAWAGIGAALLVAFAIALPWYLAVNARDPQFLQQFLLTENLDRFSGKKQHHDPTPITYYLPTIIGGTLPWTPLLFAALFPTRHATTLQLRSTIFLWVWAALIVGLFSLSSTKLISYVLPAFPAFAILMAAAMHRVLEVQWTRRFVPAALFFVNALLIAFCIIALIEPKRRLDGLLPREIAVPYFVTCAFILIIVSVAARHWWKRERVGRVVATYGAGYALFYAVLLAFAGQVAPYEDSSSMMKTLAPQLAPRGQVVQYAFQPTAIFYLARPLTIVGFRNTSGLPDSDIRRSPLFPLPNFLPTMTELEAQKNPQFIELRRKMKRALPTYLKSGALILVRRKETKFFLPAKNQAQPRVVAQNSDFILWGKSGALPNHEFNFVAPKKAR